MNPPSGSTGSSARCSGFRKARRTARRPDRQAGPRALRADPPEIRDYFRDVNDHLIRARDQLDAMRDLLSSSLQANLAQVGVRQNEDMRRISAWVAIIAVPTAIAGIYGMNFDDMPELRWTSATRRAAGDADHLHPLYRYFRRVGWL